MSKWISIKKSTPPQGELVLVCRPLLEDFFDYGIDCCSFVHFEHTNAKELVWIEAGKEWTHWMKIPKPPSKL